MAAPVVLREAGYVFDLDRVDLRAGRTASDADYRRINLKVYLPALELDDGQVLTEVAVILQSLADAQPDSPIAYPSDGVARYRLLEWLNFISTELYKTLGSAFNPALPPECKAVQVTQFERRANWLDKTLGGGHFLLDSKASIATIRATGAKSKIAARTATAALEYKPRNLVEIFSRIERFCRIASRYEKLDARYNAMLAVAAVLIWLA